MNRTLPTSIGLIGGGLAACSAASTLRTSGYDGRIYLISNESQVPYDRPPLSKDALLADAVRPDELMSEQRAGDLSVELVLADAATRLDTDAGAIELVSGRRLVVDQVLLATGGTARALPVPGADQSHVSTLRTWDDAVRVRALLRSDVPVVVIGGGFVGLEVAAAARQIGAEVTVIEHSETLLGRVLPPAVAAEIAQRHLASGIRIECGVGVREIIGHGTDGTDGTDGAVVLSDGRRIPAGAVIVGIGMNPAVELAQEAGLKCGNGILTDAVGLTSHPAIYAAGDVACTPDPWTGVATRVEQWQSAEVQGAAAARTMLGLAPDPTPVPWFWSDQGEVRLQVAGSLGTADEVVVREGADEARSWFYLRGGDLVGAAALGRPQDVRGAIQLITASAPVEAEQLADAAVDLRRLAKTLARA